MATDIYSIHFDGGAVVVSKGKLTLDPRFTLLGKPEVGYHHLRMVHSQFGRNTIPTLPANLGMNPSILPYQPSSFLKEHRTSLCTWYAIAPPPFICPTVRPPSMSRSSFLSYGDRAYNQQLWRIKVVDHVTPVKVEIAYLGLMGLGLVALKLLGFRLLIFELARFKQLGFELLGLRLSSLELRILT